MLMALCLLPMSLCAQADWNTYKLGNVCSFKIPSTMELRDGGSEFGNFANDMTKTLAVVFGKEESVLAEMKFQQAGMKSDDVEVHRKATFLYARILVDDIYLDEKIGQSDVLSLTAEDLKILNNEWKDEAQSDYRMLNPKGAFVWYPLKRSRFGGKWALVESYRRQGPGLNASMVFVRRYNFFLGKHMLRFTISYRDSEKELWADDLSKVMQTLRFQGK